MYSLISCSYI